MRTITLYDKELNVMSTFDVDYAGISMMGFFKAQLVDDRPLSVLAPLVEGVETVLYNEDGEEQTFEGYSVLNRMEKADEGHAIIFLAKEGYDAGL